jgi:adenylosuccinate lyase
MIPRYSRPEMAAIWSEERKLAAWWAVELAACEAMFELGELPADAIEALRRAQVPTPDEVLAIERVTKHDVAAFVQCMEAQVGTAAGRFIHLGMTSSDVLDTALALQLRDAADLLLADLDALAEAISARAHEHKWTPMVGRSHGIHAEPITFGVVLSIWYDEVQRHRARLEAARERVAVGAISGAVGTFASLSTEVEARALRRLGLAPAPVSNQVIQRDLHAEFFCVLALIASSLEKFAVQVRHWQRTEVGEAEEFFSKGQKGSSAMPHKRNPVLSENVTGLCRVVRAAALPAMENVALWHERDISHSSVERMLGPDATVTLDFALHRFTGVVRNLVVYPEAMQRNLDQTRGLVYSGRLLVALVREAELGREDAYKLVQASAMAAYEKGTEFRAEVDANAGITEKLSVAQIDACFDPVAALGQVDAIFERVFGLGAEASR